jgi:hypothetical protein
VARTQPSQGWCTGSIPVCAARFSLVAKPWKFSDKFGHGNCVILREKCKVVLLANRSFTKANLATRRPSYFEASWVPWLTFANGRTRDLILVSLKWPLGWWRSRRFSLTRPLPYWRAILRALEWNPEPLLLGWRFRRLASAVTGVGWWRFRRLASAVASVGRAGAFTFAFVLAPRALAFTRVLPCAGVFSLSILPVAHFERTASLRAGLDGVRGNGKRTAHQSGNRCAGNHCFPCHVDLSFSLLV